MYILLKNDGAAFYLKDNKSYIIGRSSTCDISIPDSSLSRRHAEIKIHNKIVYIEDLKSPNGSYLNGTRLQPNKETNFNVGSEIRFGIGETVFILKKDILIVTSSGLSRENKMILKKCVSDMGGQLLPDWNKKCTHVVVECLSLTVKVLSALITQQEIVTTEFFKYRASQIERNGYLPKIDHFRPKLTEDKLRKNVKLDFTIDRRRLFKNKVFVFPHSSSSYKDKIQDVINLAGGKAVSFETDPVSSEEILQSQNEYLFIITNENTQSEDTDFNKCVRFLIENKRRSIPFQEIAMAILIGSCSYDCNSSFNRVQHLFSGEKTDVTGESLVPETQTEKNQMRNSLVIPQTLDDGNFTGIDFVEDITFDNVIKETQFGLDKSEDVESILIEDDDGDDDIGVVIKRCGDLLEGTKKKSKTEDNPFKIKNVQRKITDFNKMGEATNIIKSSSQKRKSEEVEETLTKAGTSKSFLKDSSPLLKSQKTSPFNLSVRSKGKVSSNPFSMFMNNKCKNSTQVEDNSNQIEEPENIPSTSKSKNEISMFNLPKTQKGKSSKPVEVKENLFANISERALKKISKVYKDSSIQFCDKPLTVLSSTRIEEDSVPFEISTVSTLGNSNWLSKTTNDVDKSASRIDEELDQKMKDFIDSFKTKIVIVKSDSLIVRRPMLDISTNSTSVSSSQKNFKKFKKIPPVHMQTTIIPKSNFKKVICSITGVPKSDPESEDEEPKDVFVPVKKIKNKFKF